MSVKQDLTSIKTFGELKASGYQSKSVKEEIRANLIEKMKAKDEVFTGVIGYEETVIPDMERALLSQHNVILLGLRGQAKTRIARQMTDLLDPYIPVVAGSEMNDDPFRPLSRMARDLIAEKGDDTPIEWISRDDRYAEKLATPDVSVADLIGDVDPIKAASLRLPYSDERVIHFGLVPRAHRGIFVINELPDLQPRIQVALFNILQEGDIQIRGFKLRFPLDIQFVFTANPEDYTNRGSIVTPLKDRIESQILTHYPKSRELSRQITEQESKVLPTAYDIQIDDICRDLIEQVAIEARDSEYIDEKSGVSARLTITASENMHAAVERRAIINNEKHAYSRVGDLFGIIPAITGKIELVYEGEQEGPAIVAQKLISKAIREVFVEYFPNPERLKRNDPNNPYREITQWFGRGHTLDLLLDADNSTYKSSLESVPGLKALVKHLHKRVSGEEQYLLMEFVLHGLAEYSLLGKHGLEAGIQFKDLLSGMLNLGDELEDEDDYGGFYDN